LDVSNLKRSEDEMTAIIRATPRADLPLILANFVTLYLAGVILLLKLRFG
jgi:hypothetical protein